MPTSGLAPVAYRKAHPERLDPGIGRSALGAALAIHPARFEPWVERLVDESNPVVRRQLLGALCTEPDPQVLPPASVP